MLNQEANPIELLTPDEMAEADRRTMDAGLPGIVLMEHAAFAIRDALIDRFPEARRVALMAGPGNNGGDAFAAARLLAQRGLDVAVFALKPASALRGDAALAAGAWTGGARPLHALDPRRWDLVVDGLFGAGLARAVEGEAAEVIGLVNAAETPVLAIDLPSGVNGGSGRVMGTAIEADATVTFFRRKPGHLLEPGRNYCGEVTCRPIGIVSDALPAIAPQTFANEPGLWRERIGSPEAAGHKYDRGHAVIFSGGASRTGAARLAATAALRGGAGLVTMFSPAGALLINAAHLTAIMLKRCEDADELAERLTDDRMNAFVLGPGFGVGEKAATFAEAVLGAGRRLVLDADGLSSLADDPDRLCRASIAAGRSEGTSQTVLTPHTGEFKRLFPDLATDEALSKLDRARQAASRAGAVVVLKGRDTVIAAPDGRASINTTGTPWLATAGTGDVLAGTIAARLAQGAPTFEAACIGVWMHGRAAEFAGAGLIAEDLPGALAAVVAELAGDGPPRPR